MFYNVELYDRQLVVTVMVDTSERIVIMSALLLVIVIIFSQAVNLSDKFSPSEKTANQIGREFLAGEGLVVGKVLSIDLVEKESNFYWDYSLKFDRPDLIGLRTCLVVGFEQKQRTGHFFEVWIDASEYVVIGGNQCR